MLAIRFHGRGGQGAKTASRILGTAAFFEGYDVQDSPIYGAERRGAPVAAYTRIEKGPIRERGVIARPDLVVVADESLIQDPAARVFEGVHGNMTLFVNTAASSEQLRAHYGLPGRISSSDLTDLVLKAFGKVGALSAPLGAVASRLLGLKLSSLAQALTRELEELHLPAAMIRANQAVAASCYEAVPWAPVESSVKAVSQPASLWSPVYESPTKGTAMISVSGNAPLRKTGDWRTLRPVLVPEKCNGCFLCFVYCPEAAIRMAESDKPVIDYDHCKGCMLCVEECPTAALVSVREHEARETGETGGKGRIAARAYSHDR
jgi:pyruvate ferredoxin oxidoreductase gamma subunit